MGSQNNGRPYLCSEAFPLGSFDAQVTKGVVDSIQQNVRKGSPDSVDLAIELQTRLAQEARFEKHRQRLGELLIPSDLLHDVVNAWTICWKEKTKELSPRTVFKMIKAFEESFPSLQRESHPYNMIIHASVTLPDPDLAQEILIYLLETTDMTAESRADVVSFNSVLDAWAKSGQNDAPTKAEALLQKMIDYSVAGRMEVTPNVVSYNMVITAWANSNHEDAPHRAEELIRKMIARGLHPDVVCYASLLTAWARNKEDQAPDRAYAILKRMTVADIKPDAPCYSAVISAYANRGNAQRAEQILMEQCEHYKATKDRKVLPNAVCFNEVLHAWSKSKVPNLPHLVEERLQQMYDLAKSWDEPSLVPDTMSFNAVLSAWDQSRDRDAPNRSEKILERMQYLYEQGHANCQPDVVSFNSVIKCWAKSRNKEAPERAEAILRHMPCLYDAGNMGVKPNAASYNTVMHAWARSRHPEAVFRAQALFDELQKDSVTKPDLHVFATLITAWGRSKHDDRAAKAQAVFDNLLSLYTSGHQDLKPNVVVYNALIAARVKAGVPEKAEQILREMESEASLGIKPDLITYTTIMEGWSRSEDPKAADRMQGLYDEMRNKYLAGDDTVKPDGRIFKTILSTWRRTGRKDGLFKAEVVFRDMHARCLSGEAELKPLVDAFGSLFGGQL